MSELKASESHLIHKKEPGSDVPVWLRPFFSLRVQLMFMYCIVLILAVAFVSIMLFQSTSIVYVSTVTVVVIIAGGVVSFFFTSLLLRPLWRVTDAAQAIALGDFAQRERLVLRLPPQDEIDRLAGSVDEMAVHLEHAELMQHAAEQRFTRFFTDASHQLRTPLTSIRGFTEVLMRGAKDDPDTAQRVLKRMRNEAERMTVLLNDILTLARLDDSQSLKLQYIDLVDLARDSVEQARVQADGRSITFNPSSLTSLGIQADKERIKQLIFILLDNAIKHGRPAPDGTVKLQLAKQDETAVIRVIDNGEGIAEEDLKHIFDSFYRVQSRHSSSLNGSAGAGLGLTIASAIVSAHQGTIKVKSELHKGTEFTVTLPCLPS
jgi:two-component system OmpR family sensor kinase